MAFISDHQRPEVRTLSKQAFHFSFFPASVVWRAQSSYRFFKPLIVKCFTAAGFILYQLALYIIHKTSLDRLLRRLHFVWGNTFHLYGGNNTRSACDCHGSGELAMRCLTFSKPRFWDPQGIFKRVYSSILCYCLLLISLHI